MVVWRGGTRLLVVGGWDPETWAPTDSVLVYDFLTAAWRHGAAMPGPRRSFFACAAVGGKVFVAGGHDEEKNALRSALAYDPATNVVLCPLIEKIERGREEKRDMR